jgi:peptidylprolyl isomerase
LTKAIALVIIAGLAVAALLFIVLRNGGSSMPDTPPKTTAQPAPTPGPDGVVTTPSGLKYIDQVEGTGESPTVGRPVRVHYTGKLENGTQFDSSLDAGRPYTFRIGTGAVIQGWDEGILTMKVGGKRKLMIPANLAYGAAGYGSKIPPNAPLVFEVELLAVQ